jgi:hypothetical protein
MNSHATSPRVEAIIGGKSGVASAEKLFGVYEKKCDTELLTLSINSILQSVKKCY